MADHGIDVHEELAEARLSGFHLRLGLIMGLLTLFDGYDTFNPAYVIPLVEISPGKATDAAIVSALAPGSCAVTWMVGKSTFGNAATGRRR